MGFMGGLESGGVEMRIVGRGKGCCCEGVAVV